MCYVDWYRINFYFQVETAWWCRLSKEIMRRGCSKFSCEKRNKAILRNIGNARELDVETNVETFEKKNYQRY